MSKLKQVELRVHVKYLFSGWTLKPNSQQELCCLKAERRGRGKHRLVGARSLEGFAVPSLS